ncbi:hypothetical protein K438DRAFT_1884881 [Mycena galopus ATCC 62051]|nr:hypothetical protein K438DRAFT_1884881 [Mycena galopus ATCC 62051]
MFWATVSQSRVPAACLINVLAILSLFRYACTSDSSKLRIGRSTYIRESNALSTCPSGILATSRTIHLPVPTQPLRLSDSSTIARLSSAQYRPY